MFAIVFNGDLTIFVKDDFNILFTVMRINVLVFLGVLKYV